MPQLVTLTIEAGVADVRLNRPEKLNALNVAMVKSIVTTGEQLAATPGVRAVVVSGHGRAFCAGLDLASFADEADQVSELLARDHGPANLAQQAVLLWRALPVPVIAAVHGAAFGGGFQICLGADVRIVAPDARFSVMEVKWGLVPDMGGFVLMREVLSDSVARELTFTAREFNGEEAVALGVATRLSDNPYAAALALANDIATRSPDAIRAAKRLFRLAATADDSTVLRHETGEQRRLLGSPNQLEAVCASRNRRPANFADGPACQS